MAGSKPFILILLMAALLVGNVIATHNLLTAPYPGHADFAVPWEAGRTLLFDRVSPYSESASLNIQERIYGRPAIGGENPAHFAYPLYSLFAIWPLLYLPYDWAAAIWMVILEVCLIASLVMGFDLLNWWPKPWLAGILMVWTLLLYYAARGLILGQLGHLVYFLEVLTLWGLTKRRDVLAGIALSLSTLKPQMGFLLVPFLLLWGMRGRRHFVASFIASFCVLMALSFLVWPSWFGEWIDQIRLYPSYIEVGSPVWIVTQYYLGLGGIAELSVSLLLITALVWAWYRLMVERASERFLWMAMLTLTITHLVAYRTASPHFVVFVLPLLFYFQILARRYGRQGGLWVLLLVVALVIVPWVHFLTTVTPPPEKFEHPSVHLPLPIGMLILLWITRHDWWKTAPVIVSSPVPIRPGDAAGS